MPTRGNDVVRVRLEPHQRTALQAVAEREGVSVSDVIRGALAGADPGLAIALGRSVPRNYGREQAEGYWGRARADRRRPAAAANPPAEERRTEPEGDRREGERRGGAKQRRGGRRRRKR